MGAKCKNYNFFKIEAYWQNFWQKNNIFKAKNFENKPTYYILSMLPYPSGSGLHIGHPVNYIAADIIARYQRAQGKNVINPMGWDAFGLPAEQHALKTGIHPSINTGNNIEYFRSQLKRFGFSIDWDREINSTDPKFIKWTQWLFLKFFKHGLAYVDEKFVWWCPKLGTVLANEEVINGKSERGNYPVERKKLRQWILRITQYAEKLLMGLKDLDWPKSTILQQESWIGRSKGVEIFFKIKNISNKYITIFTTRPNTIFGLTCLVVSPEHPILEKIITSEYRFEVNQYLEKIKLKSELERTHLSKEKVGVFTGSYAIHPLTAKKIPIWIANYVLMSYGTGAIMSVPAHDERDYEFAIKYKLPFIQVIKSKNIKKSIKIPYLKEGIMINSGQFSELDSLIAHKKIVELLEFNNKGRKKVSYKIHDWLFSRQRYWGEPFPIIWINESDFFKLKKLKLSSIHSYLPKKPITYKKNNGYLLYAIPLPISYLPLKLPSIKSFQPSQDGKSPLANSAEWVNVLINLETGQTISANQFNIENNNQDIWVKGYRETNTMPQWAGSSWYYLRYLDPNNDKTFLDKKIEKYWGMPDCYIGGSEHAVLHLLYSRFWHKFLYEINLLTTPEPFVKLFHQGIILGEDGVKMSKSRGNTVDPLNIVNQYGADALRIFLMFLGPLEDKKVWNIQGIKGITKFLKKIWSEFINEEGKIHKKIIDKDNESSDIKKILHETIRKVTNDIKNFNFNTCISQMMIFVNYIKKAKNVTEKTVKQFLQLLNVFAPHISEEIWQRMGEKNSILEKKWPQFETELFTKDQIKIPVQINGKLSGIIKIEKCVSKSIALQTAKQLKRVRYKIAGKKIIKEIYIKGKIINILID